MKQDSNPTNGPFGNSRRERLKAHIREVNRSLDQATEFLEINAYPGENEITDPSLLNDCREFLSCAKAALRRVEGLANELASFDFLFSTKMTPCGNSQTGQADKDVLETREKAIDRIIEIIMGTVGTCINDGLEIFDQGYSDLDWNEIRWDICGRLVVELEHGLGDQVEGILVEELDEANRCRGQNRLPSVANLRARLSRLTAARKKTE